MDSSERPHSPWSPTSDNALLAYLALVKLLVHLLTNQLRLFQGRVLLHRH